MGGWRGTRLLAFLLLVPPLAGVIVVVFQPLLQGPIPGLQRLGLVLKYTYLLAPLLIAGAYAMLAQCAHRWRHAALLLGILAASFLVLAATWLSGFSDGSAIGGLLPYSDAGEYYADALRLLHGDRFTAFSSRRPLGPVLLSVLLAATDLDLRLALAALTALCAFAVWLAVREADETLGAPAGLLMLLCLFLFYRRFIGATLTEHLGLALGCLAFALVWRGAARVSLGPVLLGLILLSLGLNTRAGAFLILPTLVAWAVYEFGRPRSRLVVGTAGLVAVLAPFAVNALLLHLVGISAAAYSNFAHTLYGLVHGGDWALALHQHPELAARSALEQSEAIYALAWTQISANPFSPVAGAFRAWAAFFWGVSGAWASHVLDVLPHWFEWRDVLSMQGLSALDPAEAWVAGDIVAFYLVPVALNGLLLAGAAVAWRHRRRALARLAAWSWVGMLLSVPFVPPWDADNMRAWAATIPFLLSLPLLGTLYRRNAMAKWPTLPEPGSRAWRLGPVGLGGLVIVMLAAGPLVRGIAQPSEHLAEQRAEPGARVLRIDPRNAVHLVDGPAQSWVSRAGNVVNVETIRASRAPRPYPPVYQMLLGLAAVPPGTTVALAFNLDTGRTEYLEAATASFPRGALVVTVCATTERRGRAHVDAWACTGRAGKPSAVPPPERPGAVSASKGSAGG